MGNLLNFLKKKKRKQMKKFNLRGLGLPTKESPSIMKRVIDVNKSYNVAPRGRDAIYSILT